MSLLIPALGTVHRIKPDCRIGIVKAAVPLGTVVGLVAAPVASLTEKGDIQVVRRGVVPTGISLMVLVPAATTLAQQTGFWKMDKPQSMFILL